MSFGGSCRFFLLLSLANFSWSDTEHSTFLLKTSCTVAQPLAALHQRHIDCIWLFPHLYVHPLLYHYICRQLTSVSDLDGQRLPRLWCPAWCCFLQEEGEQRKSKTGHLQICQGSSSTPPFCPRGKTHQRKRSRPPLIPPFSVLALLCSHQDVFFLLILLFSLPDDTDSNRDGCHLVSLQFQTATSVKKVVIVSVWIFFNLV